MGPIHAIFGWRICLLAWADSILFCLFLWIPHFLVYSDPKSVIRFQNFTFENCLWYSVFVGHFWGIIRPTWKNLDLYRDIFYRYDRPACFGCGMKTLLQGAEPGTLHSNFLVRVNPSVTPLTFNSSISGSFGWGFWFFSSYIYYSSSTILFFKKSMSDWVSMFFKTEKIFD